MYKRQVVHVFYNGDESDKETFLIGTRAASTGNKDLETYSENSPLGAAVVGASEGETRSYNAPNGREISVTIVSAEPYDSDKAATPRAGSQPCLNRMARQRRWLPRSRARSGRCRSGSHPRKHQQPRRPAGSSRSRSPGPCCRWRRRGCR